ncbi:MAG: ATP-binding protein [Gemmatimonadota bacterium]
MSGKPDEARARQGSPAGVLPETGPRLHEDSIVVLNVDDYEAGRYATSRVLRQAGFDVLEAASGAEAVQLATRQPDLVVLDVNLPDFDGFEVCRRLKSDPATAGIPVLYLSALYYDLEHRIRGLEVGADAYLKQPVEPRELVATAHALLRARYVERAVRHSEERFRCLVEATSQVVWTTDPAGEIVDEQPSWTAFTGQAPEEARGSGWAEAVHPDDRGRVLAAWRAAVTGRGPFQAECRLRRRDGEFRSVAVRAVPVLESDRTVREWVGVGTDVTERIRAEAERDRALAEAERARVDAEEASRAKSGFLANMSHEIRTPINAIVGYTDLIEMGIGGPVTERQQAQLERIRLSSQHLLGLINEILDFAKVESGQMTTRFEPVPVAEVVQAALALVQPQAAKGGLEVDNRVDGDCAFGFRGDLDRVRQILVNLLSNAVKFTETGGRVIVECGVSDVPRGGARLAGEGPWTYVRVQDTGSGVPAEQAESIFEPFVQGETGHTRTKGGTGLGLAISRQLARLMEGDITLESVPGQGSAFTLWLPATGLVVEAGE